MISNLDSPLSRDLALVWIAADRAGVRLNAQMAAVVVASPVSDTVTNVNQQVRHVGWLYAADRLYQLPLGVVGIAVGIVLLPDLSRRLGAQDDAGAKHAFSRAGELSLALTIPAAVALIVIPLPVVTVLFERGATGPDDSAAIAVAVAIYGLGLPAFVLQKVLQPLFFAREDTKSPFRYAVWAMIINALVAVGLAPVLGWIAPAIATTLAGWVMVFLLAQGGRKLGDVARFDDQFRRRIWRVCMASVMMGAVLWASTVLLGPFFAISGIRFIALAALIALGMVSYAVLGQLVGAFSLRIHAHFADGTASCVDAGGRPVLTNLREPEHSTEQSQSHSEFAPNNKPKISWNKSRNPIRVNALIWFSTTRSQNM